MANDDPSTQGFTPPAGLALGLRDCAQDMDNALFLNRSDAAVHDATMHMLDLWQGGGVRDAQDIMALKSALWRVLVYADHHRWPDRDRLDVAMAGDARIAPLFSRADVLHIIIQRDMMKKTHDMLAHIRHWLVRDRDLQLAADMCALHDATWTSYAMLHVEKVLMEAEKGQVMLDVRWLADVWRLTDTVLDGQQSVGLVSRARNMCRLVGQVRTAQYGIDITRLLRARAATLSNP